ncbi:hypothetical protein CPLU01_03025 [Colletotrichum plurivorum]|uniref:Uncharacterized protein n=1 Tax=Colletotrichum plurivorum TaxID=2175906 RepID=A0A8H6KUY9_9PEZI|nr:hypothetical protein CPLU01_03025 [Colletotrichum plurivorum]
MDFQDIRRGLPCPPCRAVVGWKKVQDYFILQEVPDASTPGPADHAWSTTVHDHDSSVDMHDWDYEPDGENRRLVFAGPPSLKEAIYLVFRRDHKDPLAPRRTLRTLAACPRLRVAKHQVGIAGSGD